MNNDRKGKYPIKVDKFLIELRKDLQRKILETESAPVTPKTKLTLADKKD